MLEETSGTWGSPSMWQKFQGWQQNTRQALAQPTQQGGQGFSNPSIMDSIQSFMKPSITGGTVPSNAINGLKRFKGLFSSNMASPMNQKYMRMNPAGPMEPRAHGDVSMSLATPYSQGY